MIMDDSVDFPRTQEHNPISAFSTLDLLRNYNQFIGPTGSNLVQVYHHYACGPPVGDFTTGNRLPSDNFSFNPVVGTIHSYPNYTMPSGPPISYMKPRQRLSLLPIYTRRPRGEKKPIPDDQKDDRYYERRKRNNQAAKKSRDARKFREDQIALKAALLEHENALLKAQVLTLREETQSLRQYILKDRATTESGKFSLGKPGQQK